MSFFFCSLTESLNLQGDREQMYRLLSRYTPETMMALVTDIFYSKAGEPLPDSAHDKCYKLVYEL
jgi:hypothetical protein